MEEQLNEAWADNAKLREENSALLGRNSILEKVLALRDEQLQNLTRNQARTPYTVLTCRSVAVVARQRHHTA